MVRKTAQEWSDIVSRLEQKGERLEGGNNHGEAGWCWDLVEAIETQRRGQPDDAVEIDLTDLAVKEALDLG